MSATGHPDFSWIQPDLAVGGSFPAEVAERLASEYDLGAVIDVRAETCDDAERLAACGLTFLHLPTLDMAGVSQPMLDAGVDFAQQVAAKGLKLLVHCEHGIGRSAIVALCILAARGLTPLDALGLVKDARALVSPSEAQFRAWTTWLERQGRGPPPSYHAFGLIAYRHLSATA
ncbi:MAG TPA: dual specificity protein phosphatase family protein [Caulobacteraceae bacterium]|jgi:hypothetical protein|nr:dual specificity protein phosphatase family protein [Caulobacteraceae bacterium]